MFNFGRRLLGYFQGFSNRAEGPSLVKEFSASCSSYDLRPVVQVIVDKIKVLAETSPGPLVVLMGENHLSPCHHLLRQFVVEKLLEMSSSAALMVDKMSPRVAYGLEQPLNSLALEIEKYFSFSFSDEERARINQADRDGQYFLKLHPLNYPKFSNQYNEAQFLQRLSISAGLNDAARLYNTEERTGPFWEEGRGVYLDYSDPDTRTLVQHFASTHIDEPIPACSPMGVYLRNKMLVTRAIKHLNDSQSDIYVQSCGLLHVLGRQMHNGAASFGYKDSLCALFKEVGVTVFPVYSLVSRQGLDRLSSEAQSVLLNEGVIVPEYDDVPLIVTPDNTKNRMTQIYQDSGRDFVCDLTSTRIQDVDVNRQTEIDILRWVSGVINRDILDHQRVFPAKVSVSIHP